MVRNEFSFDGVDADVVFADGLSTEQHHVRGSTAALFAGAMWARQGVVPDYANELQVSVDSSRVVTIETGACLVEGADGINYGIRNRANKTLTLPASSGGTQISSIVFSFNSADDMRIGSVSFIRANAGEGNPTIPTGSVEIARVSVPLTGAPTVTYPAARFAQLRQTTVAAAPAGGGVSAPTARASVAQVIDITSQFAAPATATASARFPIAPFTNDNVLARDATHIYVPEPRPEPWASATNIRLHDFIVGSRGVYWSRVIEIADTTTEAGTINEFMVAPYYDSENEALYAVAVRPMLGTAIVQGMFQVLEGAVGTGRSDSGSLTWVGTANPKTMRTDEITPTIGIQSRRDNTLAFAYRGDDFLVQEFVVNLTISGMEITTTGGSQLYAAPFSYGNNLLSCPAFLAPSSLADQYLIQGRGSENITRWTRAAPNGAANGTVAAPVGSSLGVLWSLRGTPVPGHNPVLINNAVSTVGTMNQAFTLTRIGGQLYYCGVSYQPLRGADEVPPHAYLLLIPVGQAELDSGIFPEL